MWAENGNDSGLRVRNGTRAGLPNPGSLWRCPHWPAAKRGVGTVMLGRGATLFLGKHSPLCPSSFFSFFHE